MNNCAHCGTPTAGRFCGACGHEVGGATWGRGGDPDAATNMPPGQNFSSDDANATTQYSPDAQSSGPFEGYYGATGPIPLRYPQAETAANAPHTGSSPMTRTVSEPPRRSTSWLPILTAVAGLMVMALVGYLVFGRGDNAQSDTAASVNPGTSSVAAPSSSQPSSTTSSSQTSAQNNPANVAPTKNGAESSTSSSSSSSSTSTSTSPQEEFSKIGNIAGRTNYNGVDYGFVRNGSSVSVFSSDSGAKSIGSVTLQAPGNDLTFVNVAGCNKPVLVFNASRDKGSAAYGWDGSGYQAYVAQGNGDLSPSAGTGGGIPPAYGVNRRGSGIEYRDDESKKERNKGNYFDRCVGGSSDVLHFVKTP